MNDCITFMVRMFIVVPTCLERETLCRFEENSFLSAVGRVRPDSAQPGRHDGPSSREKVANLLQQEEGTVLLLCSFSVFLPISPQHYPHQYYPILSLFSLHCMTWLITEKDAFEVQSRNELFK